MTEDFQSFDFIVSHHKNNSIEESFTKDELMKKIVIRSEETNKFLVFAGEPAFWRFYDNIGEDKHYHEVIFGWHPQKIKFDFDFVSPDEDPSIEEFVKTKLLGIIIDEMNCMFFEKNLIFPSTKDISVCSSNGPIECEKRDGERAEKCDGERAGRCEKGDGERVGRCEKGDGERVERCKFKYSYHIVVTTYVVANVKVAREFYNLVIQHIPQRYQNMLDKQVYKEIQNFRLVGSSKLHSTRVKTVVDYDTDTNPHNCLITSSEGQRVLSYEEAGNAVRNLDEAMNEGVCLNELLEFLKQKSYLEHHQFREMRNNLILFDRLAPSYCHLCERVHDSDNTLMLSFNGETVIEHCRHCDKTKVIEGYNPYAESETMEHTFERVQIAPIIQTRFDELDDDHKLVYNSPALVEYPLHKSLVVKASMKMGKTKKIQEFITKNFASEIVKQKIIFVTFRQTFSNNLKEKFPNFLLYSNVTGDIDIEDNPKLIIQLESLYRVKIHPNAEPIDLVVLDEVESIIEQFNSGLHKHFEASFALFYWLMKSSKYVVCMDANVSDRTYKMIEVLRQSEDLFYYCNQYPKAKDDTFQFTYNRGEWLFEMFKKLDEGKKLVIAVNSLSEARVINQMIKEKKPTTVIAFYSSETAQNVKTRDFADVNEAWNSVDVLIYTPTITAGVSFERDHFDELFGLFVDKSCAVEICLQMIGRVRNISK
jgi:hypothetical protein